MPRWKPAPIIGGAYADDSRPWSHQDTLNYLVVPAEKEGTRSSEMLRGVPGMVLFTDLGTGLPIRGIHNVEGLLLVVSGNHLYKVSAQGAVSLIGPIPGVERVIMAHNQVDGGNQVAIANGQSGYVYDTRTNVVTQITDDGFPGAISFDFIDGYIVGIDPSRRYGFTSDLLDATSYSSLDRVSGESSPDKLVGQIVSHGQWWLFGARTAEPFVDTGATQGTFQRNSGGVIDVGAASRYSICQMDNAVVFLSEDGVVYRLNGYTPERISTHAIEQAISRCNKANAFGFVYKDRGHEVFYLTLTDGHTWGYDAASREWHRRQSQDLARWRVSCLERWNDQWIAGDYANGKLYRLDWAVQNEDGGILERRRTTGVIADNQNSVILNGVALVFDTGEKTPLGLPTIGITISGNYASAGIGSYYSSDITASGGDGSYANLRIISGTLPAWASLILVGTKLRITGTPTGTATTIHITVAVDDGSGNTGTSAQSINVIMYSAWNPANTGGGTGQGITLSAGGTIATQYGTTGTAISINKITVPTYFEIGLYNAGVPGEPCGGGVADATVLGTTPQMYTVPTSISAWLNTGTIYQNYVTLATITTPPTSRLCICVVPSTRKVWIREINGTYPGGGNPTAGTGEAGIVGGSSDLYAAGAPFAQHTTATLYADPAQFLGTVPAGFTGGF